MSKRTPKYHTPIPLYERIEVLARSKRGGEGEELRGADGKLVYPGVFVHRPPFYSDGLGCTVPPSGGKVKRLYRQTGLKCRTSGCDITVETVDGRFFWLNQVRRRRATQAEQEEAKWSES